MGYIEHWCNLLSTFLLQRADDGQIEEDNDVNREHIRIQNIKKDKSSKFIILNKRYANKIVNIANIRMLQNTIT